MRRLKKLSRLFYEIAVIPRNQDEDLARREFILNIILLGSLVLSVWSTLYLIIARFIGIATGGASMVLMIGITILFLILYILARKNFLFFVSYILIFLYFLSITYAAYQWGANLPTALLSYGLLIVISSILISTRFAFIVTNVVASVLMGLAYMERKGIISPARYWLTDTIHVSDAIQYSVVLLIIAIISWLSNRETERSLKRARTSEAALKEQRDMLEITVEARTKSLKELQLKHGAVLHRMAESGKLAAGFFHDLMSPLTALTLAVEQWSPRNKNQKSTIDEYTHQALAASRRVGNFITALQRYEIVLQNIVTFSVSEEVQQVINLLNYQTRKKNIQIDMKVERTLTLTGDLAAFHHIMHNLLINAIESYDQVTLNQPIIEVTAQQEKRRLAISVKDQGSGVPADLAAKVFEPYFSSKQPAEGRGLGLAIAKNLIESHFQGSVDLASGGINKGATVTLGFPRFN